VIFGLAAIRLLYFCLFAWWQANRQSDFKVNTIENEVDSFWVPDENRASFQKETAWT
jgi:hypothetical protein